MDIFDKLANSKFRSKFKLKDKEKLYIEEKGIETIKSHAKDFISKRIAPAEIANDGKQTPMKGHLLHNMLQGAAAEDVYLSGMVFRRIENYLITRLIILLC